MLDWERQENRQTIIGHLLVFHSTSYDDIVIALAPVVGYTFHETVDAFGEEKEPEVAPLPHHPPAFRSPFVGIFQKEVGGETSENNLTALNFPRFVTLLLHRKVEIACLSTHTARNLTAVHFILTIDIAIFASSANFGATMPRIPVGVYFPVLGHF